MRIAFVNATRKWGGVKTWMLDVGQALASRGHHIYIYGRQSEFVEQAQARTGHGELMIFGPDLNPLAVLHFFRQFRSLRVQAVFVNVEKDLATAGVAAHLLGIPLIQRIGLPDDVPLRLKTSMLHKLIRPRFFCPCRYIADGFMRNLPYIDPARVFTLITAKSVPEISLVSHTPRQLIVTQQLNADKGHEVLLHALAQVHTPYILHIVGTGSETDRLHALSRELGIAHQLVWHGFTTDVAALLRKTDIFLLASLSEGLPNTLLEALAHGLLPLVRDVGGVREVLTPELLPWLLAADADASAFAVAIEAALALSDAELLAGREAAQAACREHCDLPRMITQLENWLEQEVLGES